MMARKHTLHACACEVPVGVFKPDCKVGAFMLKQKLCSFRFTSLFVPSSFKKKPKTFRLNYLETFGLFYSFGKARILPEF